MPPDADTGDMPRLGQGTWRMGEGAAPRKQEADALRLGLDLGMTLIDTAEMYGDGAAEEVVADAIAGQRDRVFLVSKVYPHNASRTGIPAACERSLRRLRTGLPGPLLAPLARPASHRGDRRGIRGVAGTPVRSSAGACPISTRAIWRACRPSCAANQVLYNPEARGIEFDLLPWCREHGVAGDGLLPRGPGRAPAARQGAAGRRQPPRCNAGPGRHRLDLARTRRRVHPQGVRRRPCPRECRRCRAGPDPGRPGRTGRRLPAAPAQAAIWRCCDGPPLPA